MAMTSTEQRRFIQFIQRYAPDIDRMRRCLEAAGKDYASLTYVDQCENTEPTRHLALGFQVDLGKLSNVVAVPSANWDYWPCVALKLV